VSERRRTVRGREKNRVSTRRREERKEDGTDVVAVEVDESEGRVDGRRTFGAVALEDEDQVGKEELRAGIMLIYQYASRKRRETEKERKQSRERTPTNGKQGGTACLIFCLYSA
jgi:hypothetical protein